MDIHLGVIRDRQGIYTALLQSQSTNRQLAVCFNSEGKLLVKICTIVNVFANKDGVSVVLRSNADEKQPETTILIDQIQSIYPIRDFLE
jgi:hypothetical protein